MTSEDYEQMGETAAAQTQKKQLFGKLKAMADQLRSNMDASEFKNYVLGVIFYRYLSENLVRQFKEKTHFDYEQSFASDPEATKKLVSELLKIGYYIKPEHLWASLIKRISDGKFSYVELEDATRELLASTVGKGSQKDFSNLFDDMNLESEKLGTTPLDRTVLISKIMAMVDAIEFDIGSTKIDVLGDAYEFFLGDFAAASGKKGGEFYTPVCMAKLVAKLALSGRKSFNKAYDPCCGSTGLLLALKNEIPADGHVGKLYGQEMNPTTYNLGRMNMLLHDVPFSGFDVFKGDTINKPQAEKTKEQEENGTSDLSILKDSFDVIVANPPFSQDYTPTDTLLLDPRFSGPGVLAPKSFEDWLFVEHMLYCLKPGGTLAVVLAPGPMFRNGAEEQIRKYWIEQNNCLDSIVSIPQKCFYGTGISTIVCVFQKGRTKQGVYFVDGSKDFVKGKKQNSLNDEQIQRIADAVLNPDKPEIEGFAHFASLKEIRKAEFVMNVQSFVQTRKEAVHYRTEKEIIDDLSKTTEDISAMISSFKTEGDH